MTHDEFMGIVENETIALKQILGAKADEYAKNGDRLSNFRRAAMLKGCTPMQACGDLMSKQVVAIYDFLATNELSLDRWQEKIRDTINYLFLLSALISEREDIH